MSDRPPEGIYLDAALAVIGERVEERIDELSRRRRVRARWGVAALAALAVAGGSVGAYAIGSRPAATATPAAAPSASVAQALRCVSGPDAAQAAYFTVSFTVSSTVSSTGVSTGDSGAAASPAQLASVCGAARAAIAREPDLFAGLSPDRAIASAAQMLQDADIATVAVQSASFGVDAVTASGSVAFSASAVCVDAAGAVVLAAAAPMSAAEWAARCAAAGLTLAVTS